MAPVPESNDSEAKLRDSLREKDVLLREIHHRVKNNLQIITSLLRMQARSLANEDACQALMVSCARVQAMALVHEALHDSSSLSTISVADYVNRLVHYLRQGIGPHDENVTFSMNLDDVQMHPDQAIPLGLAISEILTNALCHAFPEGRVGTIRIEAGASEGRVRVVIADDGVGCEQGEAEQAGGLGVSLVRGLIETQLEGRFSMQIQDGTCVELSFPQRTSVTGTSG